MRPRVFLFIGLALTAGVVQAADSREQGFETLRNEERASRLIEEVSTDLRAHDLEAGLKKADEAVKLLPGSAQALNARGAVLTELRRFDEATKDLDAALAIDPKGFASLYNKGEILFLQKKYDDAIHWYRDMQSDNPAVSILKFKLYLCYALAKDETRARNALNAMKYPQDGAAWYFAYAADRLMNGNPKEAKRLIATAESIDPKDSQVYRDSLRNAELLK